MDNIQSNELQELLRLVSIDRISNDIEWITTISTLAINNKLYSDLLYCITNRIRMSADNSVNSINIAKLDKNEYYKLSQLSIEYWANIDNPAKYKKMKYDSIITTIRSDIYDSILVGDLQQFHFAKYLKSCFKYRFVTDYINKAYNWNELAIVDSNNIINSTFNWIKIDEKHPELLLNYLTINIAAMIREIQAGLMHRISEERDKSVISMLTPIKLNIKKTLKRLSNKVFLNQVFTEFGFMVRRN